MRILMNVSPLVPDGLTTVLLPDLVGRVAVGDEHSLSDVSPTGVIEISADQRLPRDFTPFLGTLRLLQFPQQNFTALIRHCGAPGPNRPGAHRRCRHASHHPAGK